jgi:hypothetical protein
MESIPRLRGLNVWLQVKVLLSLDWLGSEDRIVDLFDETLL